MGWNRNLVDENLVAGGRLLAAIVRFFVIDPKARIQTLEIGIDRLAETFGDGLAVGGQLIAKLGFLFCNVAFTLTLRLQVRDLGNDLRFKAMLSGLKSPKLVCEAINLPSVDRGLNGIDIPVALTKRCIRSFDGRPRARPGIDGSAKSLHV